MAEQTVYAYKVARLFWECLVCKQPHDWFDEGQLDHGSAVSNCRSCKTKTLLLLKET